jgi:hypothetical protein
MVEKEETWPGERAFSWPVKEHLAGRSKSKEAAILKRGICQCTEQN